MRRVEGAGSSAGREGAQLNCKACNTRMPSGARVCPHCGHAQPKGRLLDQPSRSQPPPPADEDRSSPGPLSPLSFTHERGRPLGDGGEDPEPEVELPLEDAMAIGGRGRAVASGPVADPPRPGASGRAAPDGARRASGPVERPTRAPGDSASGGRRAARVSVPLPLDAEALRHLLGEQPDLLEPGLRVLGEEGRRRLGIGGGTEVGEIDVLARSDSGDWVVVMIADGSPGPQWVSEILHRVGWVRKHLCEEGEGVRAIVLAEHVEEALGYAAAAVADTVAFRTWQVSIAFEPVEV